jgi:hypothetical protein
LFMLPSHGNIDRTRPRQSQQHRNQSGHHRLKSPSVAARKSTALTRTELQEAPVLRVYERAA